MKTYYVYIVKCADQSYYTGITNDIERRLYEHHYGIDPKCYTFNKRPVKLMFIQEFLNPVEAIAAEKQIKSWSRKKKEALIQNNWDLLHELAKCGNETSHVYYQKPSLDSARDDKKRYHDEKTQFRMNRISKRVLEEGKLSIDLSSIRWRSLSLLG